MQVSDAIRHMSLCTHGSLYKASLALGRTSSYLANGLSRGSTPRTDGFVRLARACHFEVLIHHRASAVELALHDGREEVVRAIREMVRLARRSLTDVSVLMGKNPHYLAQMLNGPSLPRVGTLIHIADACDADVMIRRTDGDERIVLEV